MARLAFIGLGVMGAPMAGYLATAGHEVTVYNRTLEKAQSWKQRYHGSVATTPKQAAQGAQAVFCCLGNDDSVREMVYGDFGVLAGMKAGSVLVDHTTASATLAKELNTITQEKEIGFVDAPISGGQAGAETGTLTVMCGGHVDHFNKVKPWIDSYARACQLLGEAGSGQLCKMVNQICIAGLVQGLAEAVAFSQKAGLDGKAVFDVIGKGAAGSWQMDNRHEWMLESDFAPDKGFAVDWMRKDLEICLSEARKNGAQLPITALVDQFYAQLQRQEKGRWDTSSLVERLKT